MVQPIANKSFNHTKDYEQMATTSPENSTNWTTKPSLKDRLSKKVSEAYQSVANVLSKPSTKYILSCAIGALIVNEWMKHKEHSHQKELNALLQKQNESSSFLQETSKSLCQQEKSILLQQRELNNKLAHLLARTPFLPLLSKPVPTHSNPLHVRLASKVKEFLANPAFSSVSDLNPAQKASLYKESSKIVEDWGNEKHRLFAHREWPQLKDRLLEYFEQNPSATLEAIEKAIFSIYQQSSRNSMAWVESANIAKNELWDKILGNPTISPKT